MIVNGTAVNFGFTGTNGITITSISGTLLQSADQSQAADREDIRSGIGDHVTHIFYDPHAKATLEWVITGTGLGNAITNTTLIATGGGPTIKPGTFIVITACASMPDLVGSNWEVVGEPSIKGSNVNSKRVSVSVEKRDGITAVASA